MITDFKKEYDLVGLDFINKCDEYHYSARKFVKPDKVKVKISKLKYGPNGLSRVTLRISKIGNIDAVVKSIVQDTATRLMHDVSEIKKIANKVINAWSKSPKKFQRISSISYGYVYNRPRLLTNDEYSRDVHWFYLKSFQRYEQKYLFPSVTSRDYGLVFYTGCGGDTYRDKQYFVKGLKNIDKWLNKELLTINSYDTLLKIKAGLLKFEMDMTGKKLLKHVKGI